MLVRLIGYSPDDTHITTGPLYHSGPGGFMGIGLAMGQTIILQRKFDPADWLRLVDTYQATTTFSAPTPIRMICNVADFPPESLFEVYGSTELGVNTVMRSEDQMRKPGSCGKEAPMVEIPRSIDWMDELPKTGSSKILKRESHARLCSSNNSLR